MLSGIFIMIIGVAGLIGIFIAKHKRQFKVAPFAVAAGLLLAAGLIRLSMASTTADLGAPEPESASASSSTTALTNAGKLDIDGKTYTADYDNDNQAAVAFTGHEGDKLTITDSSDQNQTVSECFDAEREKKYWFTAESEPAVLHFRVEDDRSYQTATVTVKPDPDAEAKAASESTAIARADSESASRQSAKSASVAASIRSASLASSSASVSESIAASQSALQANAASAEAERNKYNTNITFDQLARNPDDYNGEFLHLTGKVLQVLEGDEQTDLRVGIDGDYTHVVLVVYDPTIMSSRILEDDKITFYGMSLGTQTYESTLGAEITVPLVVADKIEDSGPAPDDYGY
ncbi:hypothetical protein [Lacticaseibacillus sp. GG6-2]